MHIPNLVSISTFAAMTNQCSIRIKLGAFVDRHRNLHGSLTQLYFLRSLRTLQRESHQFFAIAVRLALSSDPHSMKVAFVGNNYTGNMPVCLCIEQSCPGSMVFLASRVRR